ncbi:DUF2177 family protein [Brevundimonas sp.]|jgi:uncharacterized membrane protein|uniref:DUF2177 family protein n=1 Tax=Brevundimonas sp. TaxID=1871086 RepID=UPI00356159FD
MLKYLAAYGGSAVAFLVLDIIWLTLMGNRLYKPVLGPIMAPKVNMVAAVAFYLIYIFGITALATAPALKEASIQKALINGALLGFVAYATYDLTNQATLKTWSTTITLADLAWGTFVTTAAALAGYYASRAVSS